MRTLIELYDERPLENVLGVEVFRPERVVFVCPETVAGNKRIHWQLKDYFRHRGLEPELSFARANIYDAESVLQLLRRTVDQDPDCAVDITGGTDAVLFAAGRCSPTAASETPFSTSATPPLPRICPVRYASAWRTASAWPAAPCVPGGWTTRS